MMRLDNTNMLGTEEDEDMRETERDFEMGQHAMRWYGWGSPVGLGTFALLLSTAVALLRLAFR